MADDDLRIKFSGQPLLVIAAFAAAVPFAISNVSTSFSTTNGHVDSFKYFDSVAVGGGVVAVVAGLLALVFAVRSKAKAGVIAATALIVAIGGYHLARGFGVFAPRPSASVADDLPTAPSPPLPMPGAPRPAPAPIAGDPATCPDKNACDNLAESIKATDRKGFFVAEDRACNFGEKYSCSAAAEATDDAVKAAALYTKGCELGSEDACNDAGVANLDGTGLPKDIAHAIALFTKSCNGGALIACKNLGVLYNDGKVIPADPAKSYEFASKACGDGHVPGDLTDKVAIGCAMAGNDALAGTGTKVDVPRALELFRKACDSSARRCYDLALMFADGTGVPPDLAHARTLYRAACDADSAPACNNLGQLFLHGTGGAKKDAATAKQLFDKACKGGIDLGCKNLANLASLPAH